MIKFKDNFRGKHTDRYTFPKLGRNLMKISHVIFNFETLELLESTQGL